MKINIKTRDKTIKREFINNVASLLFMCGFILFYYIDWYWVVLFYNILFSYFAFGVYIDYNKIPEYRNKIPLFFYIMLPLIFNFVGFLISILKGFEEIPKYEIQAMKNINKNDLDEIFERTNVKASLFDKFKNK